ncbi:unnamed protein product [Discula destructiva]
MIPLLIADLNPGTFRARLNRVKTTFQGPRSTDELLGEISNSSQRVRVCAECLTDRILVDSHTTLKGSAAKTTEIHEITHDIRKQVDEMLCHQRALQATMEAIAGKNSLYQLLMEHSKSSDSVITSPTSLGGITLCGGPVSPTITPTELLGLLEVHHLSHIEDQRRVLGIGHSLDREETARAAAMVKMPQVKNWLHASSSGVVLVEGCGSRPQAGRVAPLSHVCATLIQVLQVDGPSAETQVAKTTLFFFCGQHVTENDPLGGPQGLMRSLLAQLILTLVQRNWVLHSAPIRLLHKQGFGAQELEEFALQDACQLFHQLLASVPSGSTVFVVIDGISFFEHRENWRRDFDLVVGCLARITNDEALGTLFKLLFTSPTTSSLNGLEANERVKLRAGMVTATERSMSRALFS